MTDRERLDSLLKSIDPVPNPADPPSGSWSSDVALLEIERRSTTVQTEERLTKPDPVRPLRLRRGLLIAAAAFVVVVVAIGIASLLNPGPDDAVDPTPAPTTTTPNPDLDPGALADEWQVRFEGGDLSGYEALMAADATFSCEQCGSWPSFLSQPYFGGPDEASSFWRQVSGLTAMAGGSLADSACAETSPTSATCSVVLNTGDLSVVGTGPIEFTQVFTVTDGVITDITQFDFLSSGDFSSVTLGQYSRWLQGTYPDDFAVLFSDGQPVFDTQGQSDAHQARFAEWTTAGKPRPVPVPTTVVFTRPAESLWELMQADPDLTTFVQAVEVAGLSDVFTSCANDLTVFAPTNVGILDVENAFGPGVLTGDIADGNVAALTDFINDHLLEGAFDLEGLGATPGQDLWVEHTTLAGRVVRIADNDPSTVARGITAGQFFQPSGFACNGILHKLSFVVGF